MDQRQFTSGSTNGEAACGIDKQLLEWCDRYERGELTDNEEFRLFATLESLNLLVHLGGREYYLHAADMGLCADWESQDA